MSTSRWPLGTAIPEGWTFARSRSNRLFAGVAGGLGERLGVHPALVRIAFVLLSFAGGVGIGCYLVALGISYKEAPGRAPAVRRAPTRRATVALVLVVAGGLLLARDVGLWFGDRTMWAVTLAALGTAVIWARGEDESRAAPASGTALARPGGRLPLPAGASPLEAVLGGGRTALPRLALGGLLVAAGMGYVLGTVVVNGRVANAIGGVLLSIAVTAAGLTLIFGPWVLRLARQVGEERRARIRSEERAEVAAHLHDSVLHTLALIQRADAPLEVVTLARRQERELRAWLYGQQAPVSEGRQERLGAAVEALASKVEELYAIKVDAVVVGDEPLDERSRAVLLACQEAAVNAAKHSGAPLVSVYVEAEPEAITAYVRDQGKGFDPAQVPPDRHGIADSIRGRIRRQGGTVTIASEPGAGTEVTIIVPRPREGR
jgi:signal transduction histidine kinase